MKFHSTFFGVNIYRNTRDYQLPGWRLPWVTVEHGLAADTLDGIRSLIREEVTK